MEMGFVENNIEDWKKAGEITGKAIQYGKELIVVGANIREVLDRIEEYVYSFGADMAFPAQISVNQVAAHQCAEPDDDTVFKEGDLIKLDLGAEVTGAVGDSAVTVDLGGNEKLAEASREALKKALLMLKPGVRVCDIGKVIEETINSYGFNPVRNLTGHGVGINSIHEAPSIPNFDNNDTTELKDNQLIAIEPFATDGEGYVHERGSATIYMQVDQKSVRSQFARDLLRLIEKRKGLPFTTRWLTKEMPLLKVRLGLKELLKHGVVKEFPPLAEKSDGMVSQSEHTVIVRDEPIITTKISS